MKLIRSDSPEVVRCIASAGALACWGWGGLVLVVANVLGLLIALAVSLIVSVPATVWLGVPVFLALNVFLIWRVRSPRLNWVIAGCADRMYVRFVRRVRGRADVQEPDVIMLEASEIAAMSARTVEVFLDGPKPRIVEWLVIEPTQMIAEDFSSDIRSLMCGTGLLELGKQALVANREGRLTMKWELCRPVLPVFLQQVVRECPSIVIAHEELPELDLNGIWRGISRNLRKNLNAQERQKLVQAIRLGFGCDCAGLLFRYKNISFQKAAAYLVEIEQEEAGAEHCAVQR